MVNWSRMILCKFLANANLHITKKSPKYSNVQSNSGGSCCGGHHCSGSFGLCCCRGLLVPGSASSTPNRCVSSRYNNQCFFWHLASKTQCSFSQLLTCWPGQPQKCQQRLDAFLTGTDCPAPGWLPWKSIRCSSRESQLPQY